jgi:hypothetical protein
MDYDGLALQGFFIPGKIQARINSSVRDCREPTTL